MIKRLFRRYRIKNAIEYHTQMRRSLLYARGANTTEEFHNNVKEFVANKDDLFHRALCEEHCIQRLHNLLRKYK